MTDFTQYQGTAGALSAERNKVLRNTYWLLALCLLPTVLGAWIGVSTGITRNIGGIVGMVLFIGGMMAFQFAIYRFRNSGAGVAILMAFTFFMGLMLSRLLGVVLGMGNGTTLVMAAFASTAGVFFTMATLATVIKRDLSGMGRWLFAGMIAILIAAVVNVFIGSSAMMLALTALSTLVFSLYMLYDVKNIIDGGETNYIVAATQLFIDIFAVFQNLLALFGIMGGDD
ncbi:Bax inhibitor-1 family protein [Hydrogenophaga flava]|uniref:Bax inhibitor-1 family protein n=1 Tax=Hydrogenophaga flava TaxID=65657 RepID=UPI000826F6C5|nr:Bax inhibitor-1 family protein [Hydrogenophaga flava]